MDSAATNKKKHLLIPLGTPRQPNHFVRALVFVLRTILLPVFFVLGKTAKLCFGWLENRVAKKYDEEFAQDIRANLHLLFSERRARILSNEAALSKERLSRTLEQAVNIHNERVDEQIASLRQQGSNPRIL